MFFINTKLAPSSIHGIGLFADQDIPQGTPVYQHTDNLDLRLTFAELDALPDQEQTTFYHYGYFEEKSGLWRLDHDDIRFINYSDSPNLGRHDEGPMIALRDIAAGEELTVANYLWSSIHEICNKSPFRPRA